MEIINLTPETPLEDKVYNFGKIKKGVQRTVKLQLTNAIHSSVRVSCGSCTKAVATQNGNNVEIEITYKGLSIGTFDKAVTETLIDGQNIVIKLKGTVV